MSNENVLCFPFFKFMTVYLSIVDTGQNTAFPILATADLIKYTLSSLLWTQPQHHPACTHSGVLQTPGYAYCFSFAPFWNSFNFSSIESKVKHFLSCGPVFQGPEKEDPHCKLHFPTKLAIKLSYLTMYLKSWQLAHNSCPAILNKTFGRHLFPGWFLPLTISITSLAKLHKADPSSSTQTSRIRQNLPPLSTPGMRNIVQASTLQLLSSSTTNIYLATQKTSSDTANNNLSLMVWVKFSTQTRLKAAHTHTFPNTTFPLRDDKCTISFFRYTPLYCRQAACAVPTAELSNHFKTQPLHLILSSTHNQCSQQHYNIWDG